VETLEINVLYCSTRNWELLVIKRNKHAILTWEGALCVRPWLRLNIATAVDWHHHGGGLIVLVASSSLRLYAAVGIFSFCRFRFSFFSQLLLALICDGY